MPPSDEKLEKKLGKKKVEDKTQCSFFWANCNRFGKHSLKKGQKGGKSGKNGDTLGVSVSDNGESSMIPSAGVYAIRPKRGGPAKIGLRGGRRVSSGKQHHIVKTWGKKRVAAGRKGSAQEIQTGGLARPWLTRIERKESGCEKTIPQRKEKPTTVGVKPGLYGII